MAPRISGKARLKQPGNNSVPEMANGDTSPNNPILIQVTVDTSNEDTTAHLKSATI